MVRPAMALVLALLFVAAPAALKAQNTVLLPVKVYPDDGRSTTVESVTINASSGADADSLYFQMHQPFYHRGGWETNPSGGFDPQTMVDVRLNGGPWVRVDNANVDCAYPEEVYGCVAGTYSTIRFAMSASALGGAVNGANTIDFRFNGTEGVRSGFRVLGIGFMRPGDNVESFVPEPRPEATESLIDGTDFTFSDPASWEPPAGFDDAQSVSAGEALWSAENSLEDIDGSSIVAACASCHATDGRDLQYFAYSNETITARSRAHGLSETEGKQIAAYIRSLQFDHVEGGAAATNSPGRPWNPPYQPGPTGFGPDGNQHPDEADPFYWAAGAGLAWVLDNDRETTPHVFPASGDPAAPGGTAQTQDGDLPWTRYRITDESEWGGSGGTDRGTAINLREIPLSVQLPDWNNWLPDVHPHDGMPALFNGSDVEVLFDGAESTFQSGNLSDVDRFLDNANGRYQTGIKSVVKGSEDPSDGGNTSFTVNQWIHAINGGVQWRATKIWYLQHKYGMEDKADDLFCDGSETEWCEPLGWLGSVRAVFDVGPHVSGTDVEQEPYVYGSADANRFYSHTWYQLQMVVNPGTAGSTGQNPVDEGYQEMYIAEACNAYDVPCGFRQVVSEWKFWQLMSNDIDDRKGVIPGNLTLDPVLGVVKTGDRKNVLWDKITQTSAGKAEAENWIEAFLRAVNTYMVGSPGASAPGRLDSIERTASGLDQQGFEWNAIDYDPVADGFMEDKDYASDIYQTFYGTKYAQEQGIADFFPAMSRGTLDSLAAQGDLLSPDDRDDQYPGEVTNGWSTNGPRWHDFIDYTPPATASQEVPLEAGWNLISSYVAPDPPSVSSIFGEVESDVVVVKNAAGEVYSPGGGLNEIETWSPDASYLVYMLADRSMTVEGLRLSPQRTIDLEAGWNLVPYFLSTSMSPEEAFSAIESSIVIVKDRQGRSYVPGNTDPVNTIGMLQPGNGYKMYVNEAVSFSYPSPN